MTAADITVGKEAEDRIAVASNWKLVWWRFRRHHLAMASAVLLIFMYAIVLVPDFFSTQDPERTDARQAFIPIQGVHLFDDGMLSPWVPAIVGKRNPTTLRMEWTTDPAKKAPVRFFTRRAMPPLIISDAASSSVMPFCWAICFANSASSFERTKSLSRFP